LRQPLLKVLKLNKSALLSKYESEGAAGMNLRAFLDADVSVTPLGRVKIPAGLKLEIPEGYEAQVRPRSYMALKSGFTVLNSPGTIDSDYRGGLEIIIDNLGGDNVTIKDGERIAQLVVVPVCRAFLFEAESIDKTQRAGTGFGSTGV